MFLTICQDIFLILFDFVFLYFILCYNFIENKNDFKNISSSNETDETDSSFNLQKIWSNE